MKRLFTLLLLALATPALSADRPNILFIFSDDHAQHAISAYGSKVNTTPHLDRLAAGGARFTNSFVTNSICTPSRATLLTGQYSHLNGVPVFNRFDESRDTVAKHLQAGGYHTGMIGKWHLGSDPTGFDRWVVLPGQGAYWNPQFLAPNTLLTIEGHRLNDSIYDTAASGFGLPLDVDLIERVEVIRGAVRRSVVVDTPQSIAHSSPSQPSSC